MIHHTKISDVQAVFPLDFYNFIHSYSKQTYKCVGLYIQVYRRRIDCLVLSS